MESKGGGGSTKPEDWAEIFALFESCGISREHVLNYPLPYINAVLPKIIEHSTAQSMPMMLGAGSPKTTQKVEPAPTKNGLPTARGIDDFFSGLL